MHEVLVNRLGGLSLPRKSVVRLTDRPDMTLDVYRGRKTTIQYNTRIAKTTAAHARLIVFQTPYCIYGPCSLQWHLISKAGVLLSNSAVKVHDTCIQKSRNVICISHTWCGGSVWQLIDCTPVNRV